MQNQTTHLQQNIHLHIQETLQEKDQLIETLEVTHRTMENPVTLPTMESRVMPLTEIVSVTHQTIILNRHIPHTQNLLTVPTAGVSVDKIVLQVLTDCPDKTVLLVLIYSLDRTVLQVLKACLAKTVFLAMKICLEGTV